MMVSLSLKALNRNWLILKQFVKLNYIFFVDSVIYYFTLIGVTVNKHLAHNLL